MEKAISFRPLSGIMFSIYSVALLSINDEVAFPSPLGDYVFNLYPGSDERRRTGEVSVPSRGLCFQSIQFLTLQLVF